MSTPTANITTPATFAGITEEQVKAFFAEASAHFGVSLGYSAVTPGFNTWETAPSKRGSSYITENAPTILAVVGDHLAQRRPTDPASRAAELREKAAALAAEAAELEASVTPEQPDTAALDRATA